MSLPLNSVELFTGAGGLALGLEKVGCHHLAMVEFNAQACDTIRYNVSNGQSLAKDWTLYQSDVRAIKYDEIVKSVELVAGGPPCQPFSMGGKARGRMDSRDMFPEAVRAVRELQPRYFVFENVKGLVTKKFIDGFRKWQARLDSLGYSNFAQILNAKDYGVPQNRERIFMISILRTEDEPHPSYFFPKKIKLEKRIKDILEPTVDESFYLSDKALEYFCRVNNDKTHCHNFTPKDGYYGC